MDKLKFARNIYKKRIGSKLSLLEQYAETIGLFLNREIKEIENRYKEEYEKTKFKEHLEIDDMYADDLILLEDLFPTILWSSLFTTCYSVLEYELNLICKVIRSIKGIKLKPSDLINLGIYQSQLYFKKVVGIKFPDRESHWQNIKHYNRIRNAIVHNNGRLRDSKDDNKTKAFINESSSLNIDEHDTITFTSKFIPEVIETLHLFFEDFFESWKEFNNKQSTNA